MEGGNGSRNENVGLGVWRGGRLVDDGGGEWKLVMGTNSEKKGVWHRVGGVGCLPEHGEFNVCVIGK